MWEMCWMWFRIETVDSVQRHIVDECRTADSSADILEKFEGLDHNQI